MILFTQAGTVIESSMMPIRNGRSLLSDSLMIPPVLADTSHLPDSERRSYPCGLFDSSESGLRRREPNRFSRSSMSILPETPPRGRIGTASAQRLMDGVDPGSGEIHPRRQR